jgi:hypothetical protein
MGDHTMTRTDGGRRYWSASLAWMLCAWMLMSAVLWPHPPGSGIFLVAAGLLGWAFATLAVVWPRWRVGVALVGAAVAFSIFFVGSDHAAAANRILMGVLLVIAGLVHHPGRAPLPEAPRPHALHPFPLSPEARLFVHGLGWGAVATVVMGLVTVAAMALRLWPAELPLSVLAARQVLGEHPLAVLLVPAALVQLGYGALCGGLLSTLSERVDFADALGLGLLRWLGTQLILLPALGWADFGLDRGPALALATAVPHLAYALTLGWLTTRERKHLALSAPAPARS